MHSRHHVGVTVLLHNDNGKVHNKHIVIIIDGIYTFIRMEGHTSGVASILLTRCPLLFGKEGVHIKEVSLLERDSHLEPMVHR